MKLNREDYVIDRTTDGGFYAYLVSNIQCSSYGESPEEALDGLEDVISDYVDGMYLIEDFV